jgi:hypothetical protein
VYVSLPDTDPEGKPIGRINSNGKLFVLQDNVASLGVLIDLIDAATHDGRHPTAKRPPPPVAADSQCLSRTRSGSMPKSPASSSSSSFFNRPLGTAGVPKEDSGTSSDSDAPANKGKRRKQKPGTISTDSAQDNIRVTFPKPYTLTWAKDKVRIQEDWAMRETTKNQSRQNTLVSLGITVS